MLCALTCATLRAVTPAAAPVISPGDLVAWDHDPARRPCQTPALGSMLLPPVVHEASAGVLVVDLVRQVVVFANDVAHDLAPQAKAAAVRRRVVGGRRPRGSRRRRACRGQLPRPPRAGSAVESLLRIAQGQPVTGEAVTARRSTAATDARETLWVLGLPLAGAAEPMSSLALVVFLPARNAQLIAGAQESAMNLRDRAVLATRMSFTITDPRQPRRPARLGQSRLHRDHRATPSRKSVGRNCRFLQGRAHRPRGARGDPAHRAGRRAPAHHDVAELPQGRHGVLERAVDLAGARQRRAPSRTSSACRPT